MLTVAPVSRHTRAAARSMPKALGSLGRIAPDLRQAALWSHRGPRRWRQLNLAGEKGRQPKGTKQKNAELAWFKQKLWAGWHGDEGGGLEAENGLETGSKMASKSTRMVWSVVVGTTSHSKYVLGCLGTLGAR